MADERDNQSQANEGKGQQTAGQQGQNSEFGNQGVETGSGATNTTGEKSPNAKVGAGQPIGGNDSNTGSGTTLTQGADFAGQSSTGQAQASDGTGDTLTSDEQRSGGTFGQGTTSNAGGSSVGGDRGSGSSSGTAGGAGFIGSDANTSDDYLQENVRSSGQSRSNSSTPEDTGGNDFARDGRGALDDDDTSTSS
ncbi:MAG TPA: hypothetical protein VE968_01340 [Sphingomicrobium sp.]|nr:hypothetical protein [Sphingomicrobium sp.]